jgi:hypothetical protein
VVRPRLGAFHCTCCTSVYDFIQVHTRLPPCGFTLSTTQSVVVAAWLSVHMCMSPVNLLSMHVVLLAHPSLESSPVSMQAHVAQQRPSATHAATLQLSDQQQHLPVSQPAMQAETQHRTEVQHKESVKVRWRTRLLCGIRAVLPGGSDGALQAAVPAGVAHAGAFTVPAAAAGSGSV